MALSRPCDFNRHGGPWAVARSGSAATEFVVPQNVKYTIGHGKDSVPKEICNKTHKPFSTAESNKTKVSRVTPRPGLPQQLRLRFRLKSRAPSASSHV